MTDTVLPDATAQALPRPHPSLWTGLLHASMWKISMGLATLPRLRDSNGEPPRTAEPLLGVYRLIKLCVDE